MYISNGEGYCSGYFNTFIVHLDAQDNMQEINTSMRSHYRHNFKFDNNSLLIDAVIFTC